ncbi:MAG: limonene-1,2-epoxide hydrolase family protein [Actinomycetota bacterium]
MTNEQVVRDFISGMDQPISQVREHLQKYLTDDCLWGNSGFPPARGIEDIVQKHELSEKVFGDYRLKVELLNVASNGNVVFTERVDRGVQADGTPILSVDVTGVFEVRDGKICRWTDYFDPRGLLERLAVLPDIESFFTGQTN